MEALLVLRDAGVAWKSIVVSTESLLIYMTCDRSYLVLPFVLNRLQEQFLSVFKINTCKYLFLLKIKEIRTELV